MGILNFNSKKNKQYSYKGIFSKKVFKIKPRFDEFRSTVGNNNGLKAKFIQAIDDSKKETNNNVKIRLVIILSVLILIFLFFINFDITIFFKQ